METAFTKKEWYDNFRVSHSTFEYIVGEIQVEIVRKDATKNRITDFINRKSYHSIMVMQPLVDSKLWKIKLLFGRLVTCTVDGKARIV